MKKTSKALLLSLCAVVLVTASVLGTMAYLTDKTDDVVNTFTVGNVTLGGDLQEGLDEAKVDEYGVPVEPEARTNTNKYKLVPGQTYTKDPTVHVANDSEDSYIFVKVQNGIADFEAANDDGYSMIADQITANGWTALGDGYQGIYYKEFDESIATDGEYTDLVVFEEFKIAANAQTISGWKEINEETTDITITAYAVQMDGFENAVAAWTAAAFTD